MKLLKGNPGKRPIPPEPEYAGAFPAAPAWLAADAVALAEWEHLRDVLGPARVVSPADRSLLAGLCDATARAIKTSTKARKDSRYWARADKAWDAVRKLAATFGIGPAERSRVAPLPEPENDDTERFLFAREGRR